MRLSRDERSVEASAAVAGRAANGFSGRWLS
jgi:hypothetical protein